MTYNIHRFYYIFQNICKVVFFKLKFESINVDILMTVYDSQVYFKVQIYVAGGLGVIFFYKIKEWENDTISYFPLYIEPYRHLELSLSRYILTFSFINLMLKDIDTTTNALIYVFFMAFSANVDIDIFM